MALTKRHINRVLDAGGYQFVDPATVQNLRMRYAESFMRRRLFAIEDETVIEIYRRYRTAFEDIRAQAGRVADGMGIRRVENDARGVLWRRGVMDFAEVRLRELALDVARYSYDRVVLGYMASYYGKLWMLDSITQGDVIPVRRISPTQASIAVLDGALLEDVGNRIVYDNMGREWRELYRDSLDETIIKIRRRLSSGMGDGETVDELMRGIADVLGVTIDRRRTGIPDVRANFNRVQAITRSYFIDANNRAALGVYGQHRDVVWGSEWSAAHDNRVCPTCERLNGQKWALDDLSMKHPVSDTHPMCRCSLIPVLHDNITAVPNDSPPDTSFQDWLIGFGLGYVLGDFLGRDLDSTRV